MKGNKMKTALDAIIEQEEKQLAYWKGQLHTRKGDEFFTVERMQETIDSLEFSLHYSRKHRDEFRKKSENN